MPLKDRRKAVNNKRLLKDHERNEEGIVIVQIFEIFRYYNWEKSVLRSREYEKIFFTNW